MGKVHPEPMMPERAGILLRNLKKFMDFLSERKIQMVSGMIGSKPKNYQLENETLLYEKFNEEGAKYLSVKVEDIKVALSLLSPEDRDKYLESIRKNADLAYESKVNDRWINQDVFDMGLDLAKMQSDRAELATARIKNSLSRSASVQSLPSSPRVNIHRARPSSAPNLSNPEAQQEVAAAGAPERPMNTPNTRRIMVAPLNKKDSSRSF